MGTIAQKLAYLGETKAALRQAINDAGGSISADTPFRQYADWIRDQGATLWLDFVNQNYYSKDAATHYPAGVGFDLITLTRASGGGRFNAQGQYEWLPANQPRIDYDPVTGECLGLLIEESRTNLLPYSSNFTGRWQSKIEELAGERGFTKKTALIAQEGTSGAHQWRGTSAASMVAGGTYTLSVLVMAATSSVLRLRYVGGLDETTNSAAVFDLAAGSVLAKGANISSATLKSYGGGYWLASITGVQGSTNTAYLDIGRGHGTGHLTEPAYLGDGVSVEFYVLHGQIEPGSFATSPIPTADAQVTRAPDIASVNELSPWYNPEQGTLFVEWQTAHSANERYAVSINDNTAFNDMHIRQFSGRYTRSGIVRANSVQAAGNSVTPTAAGEPFKTALAYKQNDSAYAANGVIGWTDTTCLIPEVDRMKIGVRGDGLGASIINGHIRSLRFYPRRLTNTELQALTA